MSILIIFSTIGGNTELAAKKIQQELELKSQSVVIKRVDVASPLDFIDKKLIILASPTYGQGSVEAHFTPFLNKMALSDISSYQFAVLGLGDTKYYPEYLTESAGILEEAITRGGGHIIVPALRIGMPPLKFINRLVPGWVDKIVQKIAN